MNTCTAPENIAWFSSVSTRGTVLCVVLLLILINTIIIIQTRLQIRLKDES